MSELGETFKDWRKHKREKKARIQERAVRFLEEHKIPFERLNGDNHLRVHHGGKVVDYWPSTGLWQVSKGRKGRGLFPLLREIGVMERNRQ